MCVCYCVCGCMVVYVVCVCLCVCVGGGGYLIVYFQPMTTSLDLLSTQNANLFIMISETVQYLNEGGLNKSHQLWK